MMRKTKTIPNFQSEKDERRFWETHDVVSYEPSLKKAKVSFLQPRKERGSVKKSFKL